MWATTYISISPFPVWKSWTWESSALLEIKERGRGGGDPLYQFSLPYFLTPLKFLKIISIYRNPNPNFFPPG
ncbi:dnaJ protein ERDJ2-like [Iris pallida]|uniref:DnaJ protein ERDJ2-like n=1 Tax=Iris pallida TaxID=29817 RepID=A0AAX6G207_IRIPA|nr:dnaJ protein ERDJ2-like [Iris pallida]